MNANTNMKNKLKNPVPRTVFGCVVVPRSISRCAVDHCLLPHNIGRGAGRGGFACVCICAFILCLANIVQKQNCIVDMNAHTNMKNK